MAARAREEQENLLRRVESLEARITSLEQAAQKSTNSSTQ
jgi:BMFP domain-containing protein YqiC